MKLQIAIIIQVISIYTSGILARPDLLAQQRYEFQGFHITSSNNPIASAPKNGKLRDVQTEHEPILWSQQHENEVNAFAEMFRRNYNQMIENHNKIMEMQHRATAFPFMPVTYELYHIPDDVTWNNYFGNQQQYVHDQTVQMSRQLMQDLEQGRVSYQDMMNPNFFIAQAASELNKIHNNFGNFYQEQFATFNDQQQQHHQIFSESVHRQDSDYKDQAFMFNDKTNQHQNINVETFSAVPVHEELLGVAVRNDNNENSLRPKPGKINAETSSEFSQHFGKTEVQASVSTDGTLQTHQYINERAEELISMESKPKEENLYGSTYDQQPIYDLQFVDKTSSTVKPSTVNVMSLVRNRSKVKISTTTGKPMVPPTSTTVRTSTTAITESNIMSMLPNKKPSLNYTDLYHKIRAELDTQMKQLSDNTGEETHFMGMSSNNDHEKLSYLTVANGKEHKQSRGDQPSKSDEYMYEEFTSTDHEQVLLSTSERPSTLLPVLSSTKPNQVYQPPLYAAPLAPFPTTTSKPHHNPYYTAPLAPFPDAIFQEPQITVQSQNQQSFVSTYMNQAVQSTGYTTNSHFGMQEATYDNNEQQYDIIPDNDEFQVLYEHPDNLHEQQLEVVEQRNFEMAQLHNYKEEHIYEKQLPPEQSYRNPGLQLSVAGFKHNDDSTTYELETPALTDDKPQSKNWFQRQFTKLKHAFQ